MSFTALTTSYNSRHTISNTTILNYIMGIIFSFNTYIYLNYLTYSSVIIVSLFPPGRGCPWLPQCSLCNNSWTGRQKAQICVDRLTDGCHLLFHCISTWAPIRPINIGTDRYFHYVSEPVISTSYLSVL